MNSPSRFKYPCFQVEVFKLPEIHVEVWSIWDYKTANLQCLFFQM